MTADEVFGTHTATNHGAGDGSPERHPRLAFHADTASPIVVTRSTIHPIRDHQLPNAPLVGQGGTPD